MATLTLVNTDNPEERLTFTSPMRTLDLKGANAVQLLGGVETSQRRYLYMAVLDIVESDQFDQLPPNNQNSNTTNTKPTASSFSDEVRAIVTPLTATERKAAGEIIKKHNNGSTDFGSIKDRRVQEAILNELREAYNV